MISDVMRDCSGVAIQEAFERIVTHHIPSNVWLDPANPYNGDLTTLMRVGKADPTTIDSSSLQEYIASSVIVHTSDGWNYLSRSVDALLNGDIPSAIHFAYYAELRAAMSIMASDGVGVFNSNHVWYNNLKDLAFVSNNTHAFVEEAMKAWADLNTKKNILFDFVTVNNKSLGNWIQATGFITNSTSTNSFIKTWLSRWSIDLRFGSDKLIRNEMSYRPHFEQHFVDLEVAIPKIKEIWELLEPTDANSFNHLDRHLLRMALEEMYRLNKGVEPSESSSEYEKYVSHVFDEIGESKSSTLHKFLIRQIAPDDALIFTEAKRDLQDATLNIADPLPLISRAILLLRLSTGAAKGMVDRSTLNKDDLKFWWHGLSLQHGISESPENIEAVNDLYSDVSEAIEELDQYSPAGSFKNVSVAQNNAFRPFFILKQFQRSAIWGIIS